MVSRWSSLVSCFSAASLIINKAQIIYSTFKKTHYFAFASEGCLSVGNTMVCPSSFSSLNTGWDHPGASCLRDIWKHSPLKFTATTVRQVDLPHLQWSESVFRITLLGRAGWWWWWEADHGVNLRSILCRMRLADLYNLSVWHETVLSEGWWPSKWTWLLNHGSYLAIWPNTGNSG